MKVVINVCFGGFGVSKEAQELLGWESPYGDWSKSTEELRSDPKLVEVVEKLGVEAASGPLAELRIVEIPDGVEWHIHDYDGAEHIAENHRTWY